MAHITLSQLTTVLQRIVSWATGKFAAKNTYSGKIEYADMPVVVLASMGSELDGTSTQRPMSAGSTYYLPAEQGAGARIMFVDSNGTAVKISDPESNVIYCNAYTGLLYRWDESESDMVPVGGDVDGLRKVYVGNNDFSSLDTLYSGVYQVIEQSTQRIIGVLAASSDNKFGANPYFVTQWLFSNLMLSDEYSGSFNGYYTNGRAHIIHRFYNASNSSSDIPLNTWTEWKVYGLTLDELNVLSEAINTKANDADVVKSVSVNNVEQTKDGSGNVNVSVPTMTLDDAPTAGSNNAVKSGGIKTAIDQVTPTIDANGKWVIGGVTTDKDAQGPRGNTVLVNENAVGIQGLIVNNVVDGGEDEILSAEMGKVIRQNIMKIFNALGTYAFPEGKPTLNWGSTVITHSINVNGVTGGLTIADVEVDGVSAASLPAQIAEGKSLSLRLVLPSDLYVFNDGVSITMGGVNITTQQGVWDESTGEINIAAVIDDIVISANAITYVQDGLVLHLDCKNRGGVSGHWKSLVDYNGSPIDFTFSGGVTESDSGVVFDGVDDKALAGSTLPIAKTAGTSEALFSTPSAYKAHVLVNTDQNIGVNLWTDTYNETRIGCLCSKTSSSDNTNCARFTSAQLARKMHVSLNADRILYNGQEMNDRQNGWSVINDNDVLSIGYRNGTYNAQTVYFIRVYNKKLTLAEQQQNYKVDKKRFNLE